uniref:energy transducer TonB n=1 Tax=Ningiella ruwaisensis TaxID=2364274 RepID=UPI00109F85B4|nr:energy transducer TonB [Ningiella ruwaisensis]
MTCQNLFTKKRCRVRKILVAISACLSLSAFSSAQTIPENELPCDEVEAKALESQDTFSNKERSNAEIAKRITAFTPAKPVKRIHPNYPPAAARKGAEGWVLLSFVTDEKGRVSEIEVEDSSGHRGFKKEAIKAMKKWQYSPAMKDGKPTQQCHQQIRLEFAIGGAQGASKKFVSAYQEFEKALGEKDIETARERLEALHNRDNLNRYENAFLWSADARFAQQIADEERELVSISRAIHSSGDLSGNVEYLSTEYVDYLYQRQFELQVKTLELANALATYDKIAERNNADALLAPLETYKEKVEAVIASEESIVIPGELDEDGRKYHTLARNRFGFTDIRGELDVVEVRCDTRYEVYTVAEDTVWTIPESWGQCRLLMKGSELTAFSIVELPKQV